MNIVLLGLPGAGKGTQAKKMSQEYNLPHIATGDIFRQAIREETPLGKEAKKYLDSGELVPDEITIGIVRERIQKDDCDNGFILDGFPRTLNQARALTGMLEDMGRKIDVALYIKVKEEELIKRLSGRRVCQECGAAYHVVYNPPKEEGICDLCKGKLIQRSDDKEETVKNRIRINKEKMEDLIEYYRNQGNLKTVESTGGIDEVFNKIQEIIGAGV
ncbi:adenylate kinase [Halothermothrix orenii]|uniref:Adenylate kinase n=1 Tax=Halothermothrix orenii (strain H 168 / OCM 544 / DSM 9562) TaxID=373903 RepID=B8D0S9_HALOH|nr:adenylate kinase [Halothermothrix orenii]ACL68898.1 Adenylate kinase [Halothermothrix orenii H 168]